MKKIITNWRYWVLMLVASVAIIGILGIPDGSKGSWLLLLIVSKVIGIFACILFVRLIEYWLTGRKIDEIADLIKEE